VGLRLKAGTVGFFGGPKLREIRQWQWVCA
jgi:hypothetical protein